MMNRALQIAKKLLDGIVAQKMATAARLVDQYRPYGEFLRQPNRAGKATPVDHLAIPRSATVAEEPHQPQEMATPEKCSDPEAHRTAAVEV